MTAARNRLEEFQQQTDAPLSESEIRRLMSFGERLETVWDAEETDVTIKKQIARLLVDKVVVRDGESADTVELWIHWSGGHHTSLIVPRAGRRTPTWGGGPIATFAARTEIGRPRVAGNGNR